MPTKRSDRPKRPISGRRIQCMTHTASAFARSGFPAFENPRRLAAAFNVARVRPGTSKGITDLLLPIRGSKTLCASALYYSMLVTLYKIGEVSFRLIITDGFHAKVENERFSAVGSPTIQKLTHSLFLRIRERIDYLLVELSFLQ